MSALPDFVAPMLARLVTTPFDSDQHLFEVKWDGTRSLAFVENGDYRLLNRNRNDQKPRYPELGCLGSVLPPGLLLDGEIVVLRGDRPSFRDMLTREQARAPRRIAALAKTLPAVYVAFDVLYVAGRSVMDEPLSDRRRRLEELIAPAAGSAVGRLILSDAIVGAGRALFDSVCANELEGLVAKELASPYRPGLRTDEWVKVKTVRRLPCAIVGFVPTERGDIKSLVVAALRAGELVCVGRVGSGLSAALRRDLLRRLGALERPQPVVACPFEGRWVEPELYCTVSFLEFTDDGMLRAPVFVGLVNEEQ